jgi:hypothetical protein
MPINEIISLNIPEVSLSSRSRMFWQFISFAVSVFALGMMIQIANHAAADDIRIFRSIFSMWTWLFFGFFVLGASALAFLIILMFPLGQNIITTFEKVSSLHPIWRTVGILGFVGLSPTFSLIVLQPAYIQFLDGSWVRAGIVFFLSLVGMILLKLGRKELHWSAALGLAALTQAAAYNIVTNFSLVSNYPFSLSWSEISRYYGASLFFAERLYGIKLPLSVLHPAWHILLTPPFLLGNLPIWVHRLWQAFLQVALAIALSLAFVKRLNLNKTAMVWGVAGWAFLFLMQGPILIHLLVSALIVVLWFSSVKFWRTMIVVILASIWAGLCRINWFLMPGMLAAILYLLEIRLESSKRWPTYLWKPAIWLILGTSIALISNILYTRWSGNGIVGNFSSSLASDLLWYRLLPNPTLHNGILAGLLLVSAPMFMMLFLVLLQEWRNFHLLRLSSIFSILAIFCLGGIVVSIKIGGGSDLHNMDAYLILLMLVSGYFFFKRVTPDRPFEMTTSYHTMIVFIFALLVPIWIVIQTKTAFITWDKGQANQVIQTIQQNVETATGQGKQVLFISQRHLLTFGYLNAPLVPEYEKDLLMEMVMSHNRPYLDQFQADLRSQRFGVIIDNPQAILIFTYGRWHNFGDENNVWVTEVTTPLLCYYEPATTFQTFDITIYVPRPQPCE